VLSALLDSITKSWFITVSVFANFSLSQFFVYVVYLMETSALPEWVFMECIPSCHLCYWHVRASVKQAVSLLSGSPVVGEYRMRPGHWLGSVL